MNSSRTITYDWDNGFNHSFPLPDQDPYIGYIDKIPSENNLLMHVPPYTPSRRMKDDRGEIATDVKLTERWKIHCLLSQIERYTRHIDSRIGFSPHYPLNGTLELTPTIPVSENRLRLVMQAINAAQQDKRYLLLDCRAVRYSSSGKRYPYAWLWDVYDTIARMIEPDVTTDDPEKKVRDEGLIVSDGCIYYNASPSRTNFEDDIDYLVARVTQYQVLIRDLLQRAYDEGWARFQPGSTPEGWEPVNAQLYKSSPVESVSSQYK